MNESQSIWKAAKYFSAHKATLLQNDEEYMMIDWRRDNGSVEYYINFVVDKKHGNLIISGDVGYCIAAWRCPLTIAKLKTYINDVPYFVRKIQCSTDKHTWNPDDILADIKNIFNECEYNDRIQRYIEYINNYGYSYETENNFWANIKNEIYESEYGDKFVPTSSLIDIMSYFDTEYYEWLYTCGRRINFRVYLWVTGFIMACEQLGFCEKEKSTTDTAEKQSERALVQAAGDIKYFLFGDESHPMTNNDNTEHNLSFVNWTGQSSFIVDDECNNKFDVIIKPHVDTDGKGKL